MNIPDYQGPLNILCLLRDAGLDRRIPYCWDPLNIFYICCDIHRTGHVCCDIGLDRRNPDCRLPPDIFIWSVIGLERKIKDDPKSSRRIPYKQECPGLNKMILCGKGIPDITEFFRLGNPLKKSMQKNKS